MRTEGEPKEVQLGNPRRKGQQDNAVFPETVDHPIAVGSGLAPTAGTNQYPRIHRDQVARELLEAMQESEQRGIPANLPENTKKGH